MTARRVTAAHRTDPGRRTAGRVCPEEAAVPFAHWSAYDELFTGMWLKKEAWKGAESFSELDEAIRGQ